MQSRRPGMCHPGEIAAGVKGRGSIALKSGPFLVAQPLLIWQQSGHLTLPEPLPPRLPSALRPGPVVQPRGVTGVAPIMPAAGAGMAGDTRPELY
jgi:hypothetical protein